MTDPRPICPIPPDAKVGDFVILNRYGRQRIEEVNDCEGDELPIGTDSFFINYKGEILGTEDEVLDYCVDFEYADGRKPNLPSTAKPKRTQAQRDAAWLRKLIDKIDLHIAKSDCKRVRAIADRLEGKT